MTLRRPLPEDLGSRFTTTEAQTRGIPRNRTRALDLDSPFAGIRAHIDRQRDSNATGADGPHALQSAQRRDRARDLAPRLTPGQFLSHESAAALYHAPLPLVWNAKGEIADLASSDVHVSIYGSGPLPRGAGVRGHRDRTGLAIVTWLDGIPLTTPASTWASLGQLSLGDVVALGDFFCRRWRDGMGRPDAGKQPLATIAELRHAVEAGRRVGIVNLRRALELIREDSWSPRESQLRVLMWQWGLPEPDLNIDVFTDFGRFLGCVDLAYPQLKIAIEYHGQLHGAQYAKDVERMAAMRAAGWIVIEVTSETLRSPETLMPRIRAAIASRR